MGLGISWKKAAIISAVVHLIALFIAVIFFVVVPAIQEMDTYEIDLTQSVLDDGGSGHAGGGGGNSHTYRFASRGAAGVGRQDAVAIYR